MVPEIISFNKSMSCRLQEFQNLLADVEVPCSDITEVWSSIFQELMIPNYGWQALWIMSEENCSKYNLIYPTAIIVIVETFDWDNISATVTVLAVQEDIVLPSVMQAPMIELYPLKDQNYDEDDLRVIADWLDKCRFFFNYLWYPWDAKINMKLNEWCDSHLQNRLKIQYDIQNGLFDRKTMYYYKSLLVESKKINCAIIQLTSKDLSEQEKVDVIKNCIQRKILKMELEFFEEPDLRNDLMKLRLREKTIASENSKMEMKFVWQGGDIDKLMYYLGLIKSQNDKEFPIKVFTSLQGALDNSTSGDSILLPSGIHTFNTLMNLGSGGSIKGLCNLNETKICADEYSIKKAILFACFGHIQLSNVTISRQDGIAIQIFEKEIKISNCQITSDYSPTTRGIIVSSGCSLIMENCEIVGFGMGIILQKNSKATIEDTIIRNCHGGIKMTEHSQISLNRVKILNCSEFGIRLETTEIDAALPAIGDLSILNSIPKADLKFDFKSVTLKDNKKSDVIIDNSNYLVGEAFDSNFSNESITMHDEENAG